MTKFYELKVDAGKLGDALRPNNMDFLDFGNGDWAWIPKDIQPIKIENTTNENA